MPYLIIFLLQPVFKELTQSYGSAHLSLLSLKEQLVLESHYHPSWILRNVFNAIRKKLEEGHNIAHCLKILGIPHINHQIQLHDLYKIVELLGTQHPINYPLPALLRLGITMTIPHILSISSLNYSYHNDYCSAIFCIVILCFNQYAWIAYKINLIKIHFWLYNPFEFCFFNKNIPYPLFVKEKKYLKIWSQCFELTQDLKKSAQLFSLYYRYDGLRKAERSRRYIVVFIDVLNLVFFWNLVEANFSQLYSTNINVF
ncbi:hypothetical protein EBR43_05350 [bacterium]|nr:hypothetical protein [bacterium]NBX71668.1 hypothetical protein [bacterium]